MTDTTPQAALLSEIMQTLNYGRGCYTSPRVDLVEKWQDRFDKLQATQEPVQAGELPDEREAFEAYMSDNGKWPAAVQRYDNGARGYVLLQTSTAWGIWQARAALSARTPLSDMDRAVLRMPMDMALGNDIGRLQYYQRVQGLLDRLDGIGLEVKHG